MKKSKKKLQLSSKTEWKEAVENEMDDLQYAIDRIDLPEDAVLEIEKIINIYKERIGWAIDAFKVTCEMALNEDELLEEMLFEVRYGGKHIAGERAIDIMIDITSDKGVFVKADSLAERMKLDEFIEELTANPYQLKIIA